MRPPVYQRTESLTARFHRQFVKEETGCWRWIGEHIGQMRYGGILDGPKPYKYAHRVAWELYVGPIPVGLQVLHHCDVPACVNPDHLWLGTQRDNIADMIRKGRDANRRRSKASA